jgi:hypothetical protein
MADLISDGRYIIGRSPPHPPPRDHPASHANNIIIRARVYSLHSTEGTTVFVRSVSDYYGRLGAQVLIPFISNTKYDFGLDSTDNSSSKFVVSISKKDFACHVHTARAHIGVLRASVRRAETKLFLT